tara:strand:+ start:269 stop:604 length:336 start_codon:yes stop_codon:yes gene_type:complete
LWYQQLDFHAFALVPFEREYPDLPSVWQAHFGHFAVVLIEIIAALEDPQIGSQAFSECFGPVPLKRSGDLPFDWLDFPEGQAVLKKYQLVTICLSQLALSERHSQSLAVLI